MPFALAPSRNIFDPSSRSGKFREQERPFQLRGRSMQEFLKWGIFFKKRGGGGGGGGRSNHLLGSNLYCKQIRDPDPWICPCMSTRDFRPMRSSCVVALVLSLSALWLPHWHTESTASTLH